MPDQLDSVEVKPSGVSRLLGGCSEKDVSIGFYWLGLVTNPEPNISTLCPLSFLYIKL